MSSTGIDDAKQVILDASAEARRRIERKESLLKECVKGKLSDSLGVYGDCLDDTCRYILMRNPIVITRDLCMMMSKERGRDDDD
jgi:hypothetical protein